jgi:hypothetical protein
VAAASRHFLHLLEKLPEIHRRLEDSTILISANVYGVALGQKCTILLVEESIIKSKSGFPSEGKISFNADDIIIARWIVVTTVSLVDWKKTTSFFQRPIAATHASEELGTANFKPFQVIGIISDSHGVGVPIKNSLFGTKLLRHRSKSRVPGPLLGICY